jgi:O-acetyl-ADP-ribose deacetylase (regulator of RNase III)
MDQPQTSKKGREKKIQETKSTSQDRNSSCASLPWGFKLLLVDLQPQLCEEFKIHFKTFPDVSVVNGRFEKLPEFDCMVSAGNSFGLMDGGVDAAITVFFGTQLQKKVQQYIIANFEGEQPVGTSFIVETSNKEHPYLAHTPTMRVPYSIEGTDYVYLSMKAMLNAVKKFNQANQHQIKSVACTGLGTYYGKMKLSEAARQMALAYHNFLNPPKQITWHFASVRQAEVGYGGYEGLKKVDASAESSASRRQISSVMDNLAMATAHTNRRDSDDVEEEKVEDEMDEDTEEKKQ